MTPYDQHTYALDKASLIGWPYSVTSDRRLVNSHMLPAELDIRKFHIYRSEKKGPGKPSRTIAETVLGFKRADKRRDELQLAENTANPNHSSWSRTLFIVGLADATDSL